MAWLDIFWRHRPRDWPSLGASAVGLIVLALLAAAAARNPAFEWAVVARNLFNPDILRGVWLTIWLTAFVSLVGFFFGTILALMRLSKIFVLRRAAAAYVWFFRSVPLLVQLIFWYNIAYVVPTVRLGFPGLAPMHVIETKDLISALMAAILGLSFHEAAYACEIVRGGALAVDPRLVEAAQSLGLSRWTILRKITAPLAMPSILPGAGNLIIGTLKGTSIVSVIAVADLLYSTQLIYNQTYQIVPLLIVATLWYLVMTSALSALQFGLERLFSTGLSTEAAAGERPAVAFDRVHDTRIEAAS